MTTTFRLRRLADGVLPQAVITGSLSFAHIHDLAARHGQTGWKAWTYPLSVDLLTVAAYRRLVAAHRAGAPQGVKALTWCWFLLALIASLTANVVATGGHDLLSLAVGVWPAVAFLGCTLLGHSTTTPTNNQPTDSTKRAAGTEPTPQPEQRERPAPAAAITPATASTTGRSDEVPAPLLAFARRAADDHQAKTGQPITADALRARLNVPAPLAASLHQALTT
jgi:hypothetical protein